MSVVMTPEEEYMEMERRRDYVLSIVYETNVAAITVLIDNGWSTDLTPVGQDWSLMPKLCQTASAFVSSLPRPLEPEVIVAGITFQDLYLFTETTRKITELEKQRHKIPESTWMRLISLAIQIGTMREVLAGTPAERREQSRIFMQRLEEQQLCAKKAKEEVDKRIEKGRLEIVALAQQILRDGRPPRGGWTEKALRKAIRSKTPTQSPYIVKARLTEAIEKAEIAIA